MGELRHRSGETLKASFRVLRDQPGIGIGLSVVVLMLLAGFFLPLPYSPTRPDPLNVLQPPSSLHWFGTDSNGFDVFSRTIASAARDLPLALIGTLLSALVGVPLGLLASTKGPWSERIMRGLDVFQSFPLVVLAIAIVTLMGNRLENVIIAILIVNVPRFMRLVRSEALSLRESRFIEAARAVGATPLRVMRKHMFPNVIGVVLSQTSLAAAQAIGIIAALSFLGVGVSPPNPSWGLMIQTGVRSITSGDWWVIVFPGMAVLIAVAAFNLVADGLQMRQENER